MRVLLTVLVLVVTSTAVGELSGLDQWLLEVVAPIPPSLDGVLELFAWLGFLVPPLVVLGAGLAGRRVRLLATALGATGLALVAGVGLDAVIEPMSASDIEAAGLPWAGGSPTYPTLVVVLVAGFVFGAAPFLTRPSHRMAVGGLVLSAVCLLCLVQQIPSSLLAALALGWGSAALVHLVTGSPTGIPRPSDIAAALADAGFGIVEVDPGHDETVGVRTYRTATPGDGDLVVTVLGQEAMQYGLLQALLRRIWLKDAGPTPTLTRAWALEHQSLVLLMAERAGLVVPSLVTVGVVGARDDPMVVTRPVTGTGLADIDSAALTAPVLDGVWDALERLHRAGLAHGDLRASRFVIATDGSVGFTDLSAASVIRSPEQVDRDRAALLLTTAALVGDDEAIGAMRRCDGDVVLGEVLPLLQPAAFPSRLRRSVPDVRHAVARLRDATAAAAGQESPELVELRRVSPANLLMALGALLGVYLLVGELTSIDGLRSMVADAALGWVLVVAVLSQLPQVAQAVGMIGSVTQPIPLGPATAVQFANQFMGLVGGTLATTALVIRYFQRMGLAAAVAVSSGVLNTVAAMITQAVLVTIAVLATRGDWTLPSIGGSGSSGGHSGLVWLILGASVVGGVVLTLPRFRHKLLGKVRPQLDAARDNLREVRRQPRKAVQLFGGAAASEVLFALTLAAALAAYGESLPLLQLIVINSFASLIGGIAPIPGGMGVIEAGLIAGLVAAGVPQDQATAATFLHRLFTAYLPPIWGWFSLRWLKGRSYV